MRIPDRLQRDCPSPRSTRGGPSWSCHNRSMGRADRFEELATSVAGFYQSWVIYVGRELGLFGHIRAAGSAGIAADPLATAAACRPEPVAAWLHAAHAGDLVVLEDGRARLEPDVISVLLDDTHPEYLGGQFVVAVVSSLDYAGL